MKLYCEICKGSGEVTHVMTLGEGVRGIGQSRTCQCLQCDGKGYTESPETQRLIELGKAVEKAFDCGYVLTFDDCWTLNSIESLLDWYNQ